MPDNYSENKRYILQFCYIGEIKMLGLLMVILGIGLITFLILTKRKYKKMEKVKFMFLAVVCFSLLMMTMGLENGLRNQSIEKVIGATQYLSQSNCSPTVYTTSDNITDVRFYYYEMSNEINSEKESSNGKISNKVLGQQVLPGVKCLKELNQEKVYYDFKEGYLGVHDAGLLVRTDGLITNAESVPLTELKIQSKESYSDVLNVAFDLADKGYEIAYQKELLTEETKPFYKFFSRYRWEYDKTYLSYVRSIDKTLLYDYSVVVIKGNELDKPNLQQHIKEQNWDNTQIVLETNKAAYVWSNDNWKRIK